MKSQRQDIKDIDVLINGGGIAGLTLAVCLQKKGFTVQVVERGPQLSEIGAGIWMAPNPLQIFGKLGLDRIIESDGWPIHAIEVQSCKGQTLLHTDLKSFKTEFGYYTTAIHRGTLQKIIYNSLTPETVTFGTEVQTWQESSQGLEVQLSNGLRVQTKLLIGADGLHSKIRKELFPASEERYSGSSSYRAIVNLRDDVIEQRHLSREIWGPGCRLGFSRISANSYYWYLTFDAVAGERTNAADNLAHARSLAAKHFPKYAKLVEFAEANSIIRTDISDLKHLKKWNLKNVGLIGDAAHATTPNLGQGGAQAVEDAWVLAEEIHRHGPTEQALRSFMERRQKKATWIVNTSWSYRRLCHQKSAFGCGVRDALFRILPKSVSQGQLRKIYRLWNE